MMLPRRQHRLRRGLPWAVCALIVLLASGITGCNESPGPATYDQNADIAWTTLPTESSSITENLSSSKTFELDGSEGGTFSYHHLTLEFPPGAVRGRVAVTITAPRPSLLVWDLHISKGNKFKIPVVATVTYNGMSEAKTHTMLWLDERAREWVDIGGQDYPDRGLFQVELDHFSVYGLADGTSGWD